MAINFPDSPSDNQTFVTNGRTYRYNSALGVWKIVTAGAISDLSELTDTTNLIPEDVSDLTDTTNLLFDGQYSSLAGAPTTSAASSLGTLTKTFAQNEESEITLSENISPVPNVSVFKEVPQGGLTSKGNWDVNANATNYDFFDEKPISYASTTLTPSATGDGTFTLSSGAFSSTDVGKKVVGNSGSAIITSTAGAYTSVTPFADTSAISSWQLFGAEGKSDGTGIQLTNFSNGFDLANASYTNTSFSTSTQSLDPRSVRFKPDGTKMYVTAGNSGNIYQYSLSTPYDLTTISYDGTMDLSTIITGFANGRSINFNSDGTKAYVSILSGATYHDTIFEIDLSTAWDTRTASYNSVSLLIESPNVVHEGVAFKPDGTKFWTISRQYDKVYAYTMSTAWDLSTASYDTVEKSVTTQATAPYDLYFKSDGTKMYILDNNDSIYEYDLSTAWDITTSTYNNISFSLANETASPKGIFMDVNGLYLFAAADDNETVYKYSIGSVTQPYSQYSPALTNSTGQINSSVWLDINSMTADETKNDGDVFYAVSTDDRTSWGVIKDGDGVRKIARNNSGTWQYNNAPGTTVSIGYDLANGSFTTLSSHLSQNEGYQYMHLKPDGTKVWVGGQTSDTIFEYDIGTAFDLSTVSYGRSKSFTASTQSRGFFFKPDGTRAYIADRNNYVRQLNMNTAWDISTAQTAYDEYNMNTSTSGIFFKPDGTKFYNLDDGTGRELKQFSMSTAWDITTASLDHTVNLPSDQGVSNQGVALAGNDIWFSSDGTYFFLPHSNTGNPVSANSHIDILKGVAKFSLSTAWDISSTITYLENIKQVDQNGAHLNYSPTAVNFNSDGSKMYTIVSENSSTSPAQRIMEFSTGGTTTSYNTNQTWVDGTNNNEHATLQEALGAQSFNRMDRAQLDAVTDPNHYVLGDTLDLMIAPYATSGASPLSDGVTIDYQTEALVRQAINGTDYEAEFPALNKVKIKSLAAQNLKIRVI